MEEKFSAVKIVVFGIVGVIGVALLTMGSKILEVNDEGYYRVKQSWPRGTMSVRSDPGVFFQNFGKITRYEKSGEFYFSTSSLDGGEGEGAQPVTVRFRDGSTAKISGVMKFRLPTNETHQLMLHRDYRGSDAVTMVLVRNQVIEAIKQAGPHFEAEEVYAARRSEFAALCEKQLIEGIFAVDVQEIVEFDADSNKFIDYQVRVRNDEAGAPIYEKESPIAKYGIEVLQFSVKDIDFDAKIDELIAMKKEAQQKKVVAKANADKARQDAITALEEGKARIAKAKADKEVEKIAAVTEAAKKYEVEKFAALQAKEKAKKIRAEGEAEAAANLAKVRAGLTPQERAEWNYKTAVGVADKISGANMPGILFNGGSQDGRGGSGSTALDAIGMNYLMDVHDRVMKKYGPSSK